MKYAKQLINNYPVLVLNANYFPINLSCVYEAIVLIYLGKAEEIEKRPDDSSPYVIRVTNKYNLDYLTQQPNPSKVKVWERDNFTCQYCGAVLPRHSRFLTVDHVVPKARGGQFSWDNLVTACGKCNTKKNDLTLEEAGFHLLKKPVCPTWEAYIFGHYIKSNPNWKKYFPSQGEREMRKIKEEKKVRCRNCSLWKKGRCNHTTLIDGDFTSYCVKYISRKEGLEKNCDIMKKIKKKGVRNASLYT
jgi:5-methylcytosine-specific restriction endonuclease McrA